MNSHLSPATGRQKLWIRTFGHAPWPHRALQRLTLGSLALPSPKGIEADFADLSLDFGDAEADSEPVLDPKRVQPLGVSEVVQSL